MEKIVQTAGRSALGEFASEFAHFNDDILFGENWNFEIKYVADAGSFNKAEEEAYITPTAVIKQINLLESDLGVKLFERTHRGLTLTKAGEPLCCAVSVHYPLANKNELEIQDLYDENLMMMHRGWSHYVDELRADIWKNHNRIHIVDFDFYDVEIFNRCENSNDILLAIKNWTNVHPLFKVIPVNWEHTIPFGLLHSPTPSEAVKRFLSTVQTVL